LVPTSASDTADAAVNTTEDEVEVEIEVEVQTALGPRSNTAARMVEEKRTIMVM